MFAVFCMWVKAFYWLRLFGSTSFYIKLIRETIWDIRHFFILFVFILMTFGSMIIIMNEGRGEDIIFTKYFDIKFIDAIFNQYLLVLGEFETDNFE